MLICLCHADYRATPCWSSKLTPQLTKTSPVFKSTKRTNRPWANLCISSPHFYTTWPLHDLYGDMNLYMSHSSIMVSFWNIFICYETILCSLLWIFYTLILRMYVNLLFSGITHIHNCILLVYWRPPNSYHYCYKFMLGSIFIKINFL